MVLRLPRVIPMVSSQLSRPDTRGITMRNTARQTRENRTITVNFRSEAAYFQLLGDRKARSYWIPGSWYLRMVYTDAMPFPDPSQESNRAGQHQESHRRGAVLSDGS